GIGPDDLQAIELHDAMAPAELMLYERLGLCAPGEGPRLIDEQVTTLGGRIPVNPSGGPCSPGHPGGATRLLPICEPVLPRRRAAPDRTKAEGDHGAEPGGIAAGPGFGRVWRDDLEVLSASVAPPRRRSLAPARPFPIDEDNVSRKRKEVVTSIEEAASKIKDGMTVAIGGFGADNHPMTLIREIIR